ncbi:2-phosphosulfolactate phosphatase [Accumulibacter sp.]|jgi:2-phosphosulfolactate phosphatase|uniref:Probable 2-phosphosulfolactate phosphatase n=1 Tax=Candidatus Obscuribacter phosphatis TaxID=1906157 RepID=A0A8J7TNE7_9BACT|nr:2-phosphosulfolactate phosphatase [Accumulibacter sp.]MBN8456088.1 2-phosphosulfolactate phosphatase [Accumulibacter sp.]MBN8660943.1 2-phosphosulfolactate phosphatase [Candidatus Obscuribacter phosphatis]MBO3705231.1 2-phosphosulfolactate phosphatase [Candidatus Accumulibacter conexus]
MRTRRVFLNRLDPIREPVDAVVVIDVLRSFTTAAYAFVAGAGTIYPVETIAGAFRLQRQLPDAVTTGAVGGGDPIPGFDFGNSPAELQHVHLAGRPLIQTTAAGVRGLTRFRQARALFAGSLVLARATATALLELQPAEVCFVITGEWVDRDGDEDIACADYIDALLHGEQPDPEHYAARVRDSDFGRRFLAADNPNLPPRDLHLCAQADRFDFALSAAHVDGHLQIRRLRSGAARQSPAAGEVRNALRLPGSGGTPSAAQPDGC